MSEKTARILKEARLKQQLTQVEVAERAGLNPNAYAKIERGESDPTTESIRKLINVLDIDANKVL